LGRTLVLWLIIKLINVNDLMMSSTSRDGRNRGSFNCYGHLTVHKVCGFGGRGVVVVVVDVDV
jgi:hypothetical protein